MLLLFSHVPMQVITSPNEALFSVSLVFSILSGKHFVEKKLFAKNVNPN